MEKNRQQRPGFVGEYEATVLGDGRLRLPDQVVRQLRAHNARQLWVTAIPGTKAVVLCPEASWVRWVGGKRPVNPIL